MTLNRLWRLITKKGRCYIVEGIVVAQEQVKNLIEKNNKSNSEGQYQFQYLAIEQVKDLTNTKKVVMENKWLYILL